MLPTLIAFGPLTISSFGVFMALSFLVFSFMIWRNLRDKGIDDSRIFDNVIVVSICALVGARIFYVAAHWQLFSDNLLRTLVIWRYPGLSFWGGFIAAVVVLILYGLKQKIPFTYIFDSYGKAFPMAMFFVALGVFLDGSVKGQATNWILGMKEVGEVGMFHPVGLYAAFLSFLYLIFMFAVLTFIPKKEIPGGVFGWFAVIFIGLTQVILAFFRRDLLYVQGLSIDYVFGTIVMIMPTAPLFTLVGGREKVSQYVHILKSKLNKKAV